MVVAQELKLVAPKYSTYLALVVSQQERSERPYKIVVQETDRLDIQSVDVTPLVVAFTFFGIHTVTFVDAYGQERVLFDQAPLSLSNLVIVDGPPYLVSSRMCELPAEQQFRSFGFVGLMDPNVHECTYGKNHITRIPRA